MRAPSYKAIWLLFASASPSLAAFEDFYFAGNGGNNTALRKCGNMPFACEPPNMCSRDTRTKKYYCCGPGVSDAVCWTNAPKCDGSVTNTPSTDQIACGGTTPFCCLKDSERCTQAYNQINICWSTQDNALQPLNASRLNDTFKSLSAASPSASSYTIDRQALTQMTSTVPGASSSAHATSSTSTPSSSSSAAAAAASTTSSGISGGAIGGIVGGVVGGLAIIGLAVFFLLRRRKNAKAKLNPHAPPSDPYQNYSYQPGYQPEQTHQQYQGQYSPQTAVAEVSGQNPPLTKYAHMHQSGPHEAPVTQAPVEMPATQHVPSSEQAMYK